MVHAMLCMSQVCVVTVMVSTWAREWVVCRRDAGHGPAGLSGRGDDGGLDAPHHALPPVQVLGQPHWHAARGGAQHLGQWDLGTR